MPAPSRRTSGAPLARPCRVLVVDHESVARALDLTAGRLALAAVTVSSIEHAVARLRTGAFDVVVADQGMPGCGGLALLRAVRELGLEVPVILTTSTPSVETATEALENGAYRYLAKPVAAPKLRELVERTLAPKPAAPVREAPMTHSESGKWQIDRSGLEERFERALETLWVAFQPIASWSGHKVYGYEALLRTSEPTMRNPLVFLEASEILGREHELGRAVRARAAAAPPPDGAHLFVNLHASDLADEELYSPRSPLAALADRVVIEITERMSLDNVEDLDARVAKLRARGYRIAVDDLGAGYAGLSSFAQLEPDVAKIDMSLVRDIHAKPKKQSIVRSLQRLCVELGIELVAEGVERREERDTLVSLGCDLFQGYLLARPGPGFPVPDWT